METALLPSDRAGPSARGRARAPPAGLSGILRHQYKYLSVIILLKGIFPGAETGGAALPTAEERADP